MQQKYILFQEVKARADYLLKQLCEGDYYSVEIYANNVIHLHKTYQEFEVYTSDKEFLRWLQMEHNSALVEVMMMGKVIMVIYNFFRFQ